MPWEFKQQPFETTGPSTPLPQQQTGKTNLRQELQSDFQAFCPPLACLAQLRPKLLGMIYSNTAGNAKPGRVRITTRAFETVNI